MSNHHRMSGHTHTPYDDFAAAERRWGHLSPDELRAAADADPLRFVADNISVRDRRQGSVVLIANLGPGQPPALVVVPDAPPEPTFEDCALLVGRFGMHLDEIRDVGAPFSVGLIHHRLGNTAVNDLDRRWQLALETLAPEFGYSILGVMARTESGALVTVIASSATRESSRSSGRTTA
ncbi:MAG: hypothetical protein NTZ03_13875 [Actinobacteria bacterium]|nr:hypothetical protein [Actinomycetota bacterium]